MLFNLGCFSQIQLVNPISTQPVPVAPLNKLFQFQMDPTTFFSNSSFDLKLIGGPSWVSFDKSTLTFSGTPPATGTFDVILEAFSSQGNTAVDHLVLKSISGDLSSAPVLVSSDAVSLSTKKNFNLKLLSKPATGFGLKAFGNRKELPGWIKFDSLSGEMSGVPPSDVEIQIDVYFSDSDVRLVKSSATSFKLSTNNHAPTIIIDSVSNNSKILLDKDFLVLKYKFSDPENNPCKLVNLPSDIENLDNQLKIPKSYLTKSLSLVANDGVSSSDPFILFFTNDKNKATTIGPDGKGSSDKTTLLYTLAAVGSILFFCISAYLLRKKVNSRLLKKTAYVDLGSPTSSKASMDSKDQIYSMYYDRNSNRGSKVSITSYSTHTVVKGSTVAKLQQHSVVAKNYMQNVPANQYAPVFTKVIAKYKLWTYSPLQLDRSSLYNMPQKGMRADWKLDDYILGQGNFSIRTDGNSVVPTWLTFDPNSVTFKGTPDHECDLIIRIEYRKNGAFTDDFIFRLIVSHEKKATNDVLNPDRFMDSIFSTNSRQDRQLSRNSSVRFSSMNFTDFKKYINISSKKDPIDELI
eukprot:NODE_428_length_7645_cov_0.433740.p1 type:complete len:577 gc:universal NODE_428_length_7645_cov_0.433740:5833-7563(+)